MTSFSHNELEHLRDLDLMIAYLKDEVSLEEVEQIEQLMEEDALYKLSMEQLSTYISSDTSLSKTQIQRLEGNFPGLLEKTRENFILTLEENSGGSNNNNGNWFTSLPPWLRLSSFLAIVALLGIAIFVSMQRNDLPQNLAQNLELDGDIQVADNFMTNCGQGIGAGEEISLEKTFFNEYVEGNYEAAAKQLALFENNLFLSKECQTTITFYLAKSHLASGNHKSAIESFEKITSQSDASLKIKNASFWYLGNIYLVNEEYKKAQENFSQLVENDQVSEDEHLQALMEKNYLVKAQESLVYLADKY